MMHLDMLPTSEPDEKVVLFLRRHWIDLLKIFAFTSFLLLVPVGVIILFQVANSDFFADPLSGPVGSLILAGYLFIVLVLTMTQMTDYWLDVWIVTTERIINIEQHGLFNRVISEVHLHQIQDITSETKGLTETFLTYGDVYVQTAAERERFQFKNVDNPDDVKVKISELVKTCKGSHNHEHGHNELSR